MAIDPRNFWSLPVRRLLSTFLSKTICTLRIAGARFYHLWHGIDVKPAERADKWSLSFDIEAHGFRAILAFQNGDEAPQLSPVLTQMKEGYLLTGAFEGSRRQASVRSSWLARCG